MLSIDGIEEVVVVPVDSHEFGTRPIAFLKGEWLEFELIEKLEMCLARFEIPDRFEPWPVKVESTGMKVNREGIKNYLTSATSRRQNS